MPDGGFEVGEELHEGRYTQVFRARRLTDGQPVVSKQLRGPHPTPHRIATLDREQEIAASLSGEGFVELLGRELVDGLPALIFADDGSQSAARALAGRQGPLPLREALQIGRGAAVALRRLHAASVIHKDVNPSNILWNRESGEVRLIDFDISARGRNRTLAPTSPARVEGTLPYIAPEQTGRMNRRLDYRADLYSLGASLHELICGQPPFDADDALGFVHAHIARTPPPLVELDPDIPQAVADIVWKLLEKEPEERYQSAFGLESDLTDCLAQLQRHGRIEPFPIAERDVVPELRISQRLEGRQDEVATLFSAFDRARRGTLEFLLVAGYSGIGKTALVQELHRPVTTRRGHYVAGKFEQYNRATPYASLLQAFGRFLRRILVAPEAAVQTWRTRLSEALGDLGGALADVLPELELVLGPQAAAPPLPPAESANRFQIAFRRFLGALASEDGPLVIFLDDLQWADAPSLTLLGQILVDPEARHTLIVGAFRDNEVDAAHPLTQMLGAVAAAGRPVPTISLGPLSREDVGRIVADTLRTQVKRTAPLTALCYDKTAGNPFFLHQFLESLHSEALLRFDHERGLWAWDLAAIEERGFTDNVVDFMRDRIERFDPETQRALATGAFIGSEFALSDVAALVDGRPGQIWQLLQAPLDEDLLTQTGHGVDARLGFVHDRIQAAAYGLTPQDEAAAMHLSVGRHLIEGLADEPDGQELFAIAAHLVAAGGAAVGAPDARGFSQICLQAGMRALAAAAYPPAFSYLTTAVGLLADDAWESDYELALALHGECASAAFLARQEEAMGRHVSSLRRHARDDLDKVRAYEVEIYAAHGAGHMNRSLDLGLPVLRLLGVDLPDQPGDAEVGAGLGATLEALAPLGESLVDAIIAMPDATDPRVRAACRILNTLTSPAYFSRPALLPLLAFELVQSTVRNGVTPESQYGIVVFGLILCAIGELDKGAAAGDLAMRLTDRSEDRRIHNLTKHVFNTHIRFWNDPWPDLRQPEREVFRDGYDLGDFLFASFGANMSCLVGFLVGSPMGELLAECDLYAERIRRLEQSIPLGLQRMLLHAMVRLTGSAARPEGSPENAFDADEAYAISTEAGDTTSLYVLNTFDALVALYMGEYDKAAKAADRNQAHLAGGASSLYVPTYQWLDVMAHLAAWEQLDEEVRPAIRTRIEQGFELLQTWSARAPANHAHRVALIEAEMARLWGDSGAVHEHYVRAIALAGDQGFLQDQALANERAGAWFVAQQNPTVARAYLAEARYLYLLWGAEEKVARLDAEHGRLMGDSPGPGPRARTSKTTSPTTQVAALDAVAAIRASRAISQEIALDRLVGALLELALEASGARKALLVRMQAGKPVLEAAATVDVRLHVDHLGIALDDYAEGPDAILRYVRRTSAPVVLADALSDGLFVDDPYIVDGQVRSVLCVPLEQQGKLQAILYLENDQTAGTFTEDRVELLQVLAAQAAISIENATVFDRLEAKVQERTKLLSEARRRSDGLLLNILPATIAEELKSTGQSEPVLFDSATVLFTDFKGFTAVAERMTAKQLVAALDEAFTEFDGIIDQHGLEKLKTIGDAYMCVGGIPRANRTHAIDALLAGLQFQAYMAEEQADRRTRDEESWELRIGIHTGPLVAGVIGRRKFAYDVWGETVNTASRMESSGAAGRVNISAATYRYARQLFACTDRGLVEAKGLGAVQMYFLDRILPRLSADEVGLVPNAAFHDARAEIEAELSD